MLQKPIILYAETLTLEALETLESAFIFDPILMELN